MAKAGKFLGLISPVLAIGVAALMLFGSTCNYESADCRTSHAHQPSHSECEYRSGTISAFRAALEEGDSTLFSCSGIVVIVTLVAAAGGSYRKGRPCNGPAPLLSGSWRVWGC